MSDLLSYLKHARDIAQGAGKILYDRYLKPHDIHYKGEIDLVTEADIASEQFIKDSLEEFQIPVLAEESGSTAALNNNDLIWVVDPLDGTTNFAHGFPWFCVSIALCKDRKPLLGVIYQPVLKECFWALTGHGAWLNDIQISPSNTGELNRALLATGFPYDIHTNHKDVIGAFKCMILKSQGIRRAGAAALDMAYVACGRLDGFWEIKLKPWDTAAGQVLIEEAGGKVTDFNGKPYDPWIPELLTSNSLIHNEMVENLSTFHNIETGDLK